MTEADLIRLLSERFHGNFADETARRVRDAGAVDLLYEVATAPHPELPGPVRQKVLFRGAYVLERIYFDAPEAFMPRAESFCRVDFAACANASAQRHFGKIMADLLGRYAPEPGDLERIAETAAGWAVSPEAKVAVKVWAVEVLKRCRERGRLGRRIVGRHRGDGGPRRYAGHRKPDAQKLENEVVTGSEQNKNPADVSGVFRSERAAISRRRSARAVVF